jgi:hypothetical protein
MNLEKAFIALVPDNIRDIAPDVLDDNGRLKILPAKYWATTTEAERALFGLQHGIYSFPTIELVNFLTATIGERTAIEIGAGNGVLADRLGIRATDNFQQRMPKYIERYRMMKQPTVPYGDNVEDIDANRAVRKYKPQVVIACWVTHKYDKRRHSAGGNEIGVKEEEIIAGCERYVVIGNEYVHEGKSIWSLPHEIIYPDWLYSRATNDTRDFIAVWNR